FPGDVVAFRVIVESGVEYNFRLLTVDGIRVEDAVGDKGAILGCARGSFVLNAAHFSSRHPEEVHHDPVVALSENPDVDNFIESARTTVPDIKVEDET